MRPVSVVLGAAGNSPWIPINYLQVPNNIGFAVTLSSGASLTYTVQHTFDDVSIDALRLVSISRTTTTATVTDPDHGLSVGDSIMIRDTGSSNLDGTYSVASVVDANTYTYTVANTGATAATGKVKSFRVFNHEDVASKTDRQDGNYAFPVRAIRLNISTYASGKATLTILQGMGR